MNDDGLSERPVDVGLVTFSVTLAVCVPDATVIEAASDGIQLKQGEQTLILKNGSARDVNYLATGDTMRARYVDSDTGQVTINNVYVP